MIGIDVYAAALTVFFGYDAATALYEKKKHSTMGRLEDPKAHAQAVAGICRKWAIRKDDGAELAAGRLYPGAS